MEINILTIPDNNNNVFFMIEPLQKMEMSETTCFLAVFLHETCNHKKLLEERLRSMNTSYRLFFIYFFFHAVNGKRLRSPTSELYRVFTRLLLPAATAGRSLSFSSQVLSQTISRLAWPPLSVSPLSEGKVGGDGTWRRRRRRRGVGAGV